MRASMKVVTTLAVTVSVVGILSLKSVQAQEPSVEEELHIHRLHTTTFSPYDAFTYLNRIPTAPDEGQSPAEFAGNVIFSRLSNMEGRIQIKEMEGFHRPAYLGYKSFLRAWPDEKGVAVGNCVVCHTPPNFTSGAKYIVDESGQPKAAPSLRNLKKTDAELKAIIQKKVQMAERARAGETSLDEAYKLIQLNETDVDNLVAFLKSLDEVPEDHFRQIIVESTILDTSDLL
jgi:hypothetical protein